jgi:sugar phosphate isomerase/epimerase
VSIGLGTYAYFWRSTASDGGAISLPDMLTETSRLGGSVFQICDYSPIEAMTRDELMNVRDQASSLGIALELGTRGVQPDHLAHYLELAKLLGCSLVRSMLHTADPHPSPALERELLAEILPDFEAAGVVIALETYEQVGCDELVRLMESVDSRSLGICFDPAQSIAALELPHEVIERTAPHVVSLHIKDFAFSRRAGGQGFTLTGIPLGDGQLDYQHLVETIQPDARGINQILEHWLPWQGTQEETAALESSWTTHGMDFLLSR